MKELREALSMITSAWAVAFIVLFFVALADECRDPYVIVTLLVGGVTGAGWLAYRRKKVAAQEKGR